MYFLSFESIVLVAATLDWVGGDATRCCCNVVKARVATAPLVLAEVASLDCRLRARERERRMVEVVEFRGDTLNEEWRLLLVATKELVCLVLLRVGCLKWFFLVSTEIIINEDDFNFSGSLYK